MAGDQHRIGDMMKIGPINISFGKEEAEHELEPKGGKTKTSIDWGDVKSKLDTQSERIAPVRLENMFYDEPVLQTGLVYYQELIKEAGFIVKVLDRPTQKLINELFQETSLRYEYEEYAALHLGIFGNFWLEHIFGKKKFITDFLAVDPKKMDGFKKKHEGSDIVDVDRLGRPKAYVYKTNFSKKVPYVPEIEMSHRFHIQVTHTQLGLGKIEALFRDSTLKENLEQARATAAFDLAYKKPVIGYGSEIFPPDARMESKAIKLGGELTDPDVEYVVYPRAEMKVDWPAMEELTNELLDQIMYTTKLQAAVLGVPVALLLQTSKEDSQHGLAELMDMFEVRFRGFQKKLRIEETVKNVINWNNSKKPKNEQIDLDWRGLHTEYGILSDRAAKEFVMRLMRMGKSEMVNKDDPKVKEKIDQVLGIIRDEDDDDDQDGEEQ